VLLADEPTASLDDQNATDAVQLLWTTAHRLGATLVIATHDARVGHTLHGLAPGGADAMLQRLVLGPVASSGATP